MAETEKKTVEQPKTATAPDGTELVQVSSSEKFAAMARQGGKYALKAGKYAMLGAIAAESNIWGVWAAKEAVEGVERAIKKVTSKTA